MRPVAAGLVVLSAFAVAGEEKIRREGGGWVAESTGTIPAQGSQKFKAVTRARLTVRGTESASESEVSYRWVRRVRSSNEQAARAALLKSALKTGRKGEWLWTVAEPVEGEQAELSLTIPRSLRVLAFENRSGSSSVCELTADLQLSAGGGNIEMDSIQGNVSARTGGGSMSVGKIVGNLRCMSGGGSIRIEKVTGESTLETAGGEIYLLESGGPVRASAVGNVHIGTAGSTVSAHSAGGLIEVDRAGGIVTAESAGGSILVGPAPGVRCESAGGTIKLKGVWGTLRATTATGNVFAVLDDTKPLENSFLATGRGDVAVYLPSNKAVTIKALNESAGWLGRIVSEFPEIQVQRPVGGASRTVEAEGSLNGGGPVVMISVAGGTVYLRRQR